MTSLGDARIHFYLRHQIQIDDWATLRSEAAIEIHQWLVGLGDDICALAEAIDHRILLERFVEDPWPRFMLRRPEWPVEDDDATVSVAFEWPRGTLLSNIGQPGSPFVGVRIPRTHKMAAVVRPLFDASVLAKLPSLGYPDRPTPNWAAWKRVEATGDYWIDMEPYRQHAVEEVRKAWLLFEEQIEVAINRR